MTTLADAKLTALEALTGNTGHTNDLEAEFLVLLGATAGSTIVDQWWEVFDAAAVPAGQFNDRAVKYIVAEVGAPPSDDYNEHWRFYWENVTVGPVVPVPPLLPDLLHWFDFSDQSVLWQDAAGTVPIVAGTDVIRVDNKGTDGTPLIDAFPPGPIWTLNLVNGLAGAKHTANFSPMQQTGWLGAGGASGQVNFGWGRREALGPSTGVFWQMSGGGGADSLRADDAALPQDWAGNVAGLPIPTTTGKSFVLDEWDWVYFGVDNTLTQIRRAGGVAEISGGGVYAPPGAPSTVSLGMPAGELIEVLVYGRGLTPAEVLLVIAYMDARAGKIMPFIEPPTTVVDLIHWYDFADNTTVFKNPPATQLASDGDFIRVLHDKGLNATDLSSASDSASPIYRTGILNSQNIADFVPGTSKRLDAVETFGQLGSKGMTNAIVFKLPGALGPAVQMVDWGSGGARLRILRDFGAGFMLYDYPGPVGAFSNFVIVPDAWYLWYASFTGAAVPGDDRARLSGEALQILGGVAPDTIPPGEPIAFEHVLGQDIQIAEWAVWDGPLTDPELADLEAYVLQKYGVLPALPLPAPANLLHHVDASDASTVWADAAGTIPATNGVTVERIDNKGTRGTPFLRVGFGGVEYKTSVLNGENVIEFTSANGQLTIVAESPGLAISTTGCTLAMVVRRRAALGAGTGILWRWTPFGGAPGPGLRHASTSEDFITIIGGIPNETLKAATVLDTWYLIYISIDPAGAVDDATFGSPGPEVVAAIGNPTDIPDLADFRWGTSIATMESAEAFFWDRPLTLAERAQLVAHLDAKYGTLPHL